jgi:hypothetical protein
VDRVLFIDPCDTFFQSDPFEHMIVGDELVLVSEGLKLGKCSRNRRWIRRSLGHMGTMQPLTLKTFPWDRPIINSGLLGGGVAKVRRLVDLLLSAGRAVAAMGVDQPILNIFAWSGELERRNLTFRLDGCNGSALHQYCGKGRVYLPGSSKLFGMFESAIKGQNLRALTAGEARASGVRVPAVYHQWNRHVFMRDMLGRRCHLMLSELPSIWL